MQKLEKLSGTGLEIWSGTGEKNATEDRWGFLGKKRNSKYGKDKDGKRCIKDFNTCSFDCTCCSGKCITKIRRGHYYSQCAKTET